MIEPLAVAAVLVAVAEIGDKTQLLTLVLASRYPARRVFAGVVMAVLALQLLAVVAGAMVGDIVPGRVGALLAAALFVGFGVWSLRGAGRVHEEVVRERGAAWGPIAAVAATFFLAELGDKTQVLTFAIAADPAVGERALGLLASGDGAPVAGVAALAGVWIGSALGMLFVNGLAIWAGSVLGRRLPRRRLAQVSGIALIAFGLVAFGAAYLS
ncbi:MAG TPA: TMEM165/GDT1 family protein [Coriobacteriia bacterium]|nr:TMEM165/GDT1 family protein [Coriobacteriia bacterium]